MKTELLHVTPQLAQQLLAHNKQNRPIRWSHVETLRASFARGEYVPTHQGIAFAVDGDLIDGQHRLHAISLIDDAAAVFPMLVTRGLDRASAFPVVDATAAKRSTSDVLSVNRSTGECANFFAKLYAGRTQGITPSYAIPFAEFVALHLPAIIEFAPRSVKTWSSAPVRCAAMIATILGDRDYVLTTYLALVSADFASMHPVTQALFRAHMAGNVRAANSYDIFARCLKAFDYRNAQLTKIQIKNQSRLIASVREMLDVEVFGVKKKAPAVVNRGAKSVPRVNHTLDGI